MTVGSVVPELRPEVFRDVATSEQLDDVASWLGVTDGHRLARTFPQVYHQMGRGRRWAILDPAADKRPLSHVATYDVEVRTHGDTVQVRMIGSVATDPTCRGRGMAGTILRDVIEQSRRDRVDALVLWSDLHDFYGTLGFQAEGVQFALPIRPSAQRAADGFTLREALASDLPAIHAIHEAKPTGVARSLADLAILLTAQPMRTFVLERDEQVCAYACLGKGADFTGWWHELGGDDADVRRLIESSMQASGTAEALILAPRYRSDLRRQLHPTAAEQVGFLRLAFTTRGANEFFVDGLDSI